MSDQDKEVNYNANAMLGGVDLGEEFVPPKTQEETPQEDTETEETTPGSEDTNADTETNESDKDDTGTETVRNDLTTVFNELGLNGTYKDAEEALRRLPHHNSHITKLEQENAEFRRLQAQRQVQTETPKQPEPQVTIDGDTFYENPSESMEKMGYVREQDVNMMVQRRMDEVNRQREAQASNDRATKFVQDTADYQSVKPYMDKVFADNPQLSSLPSDNGIKILYQLGKAEMLKASQQTENIVEKSDANKTNRQRTSGGRTTTKSKPHQLTPDKLASMSLKDIEEQVGYGD